MKYLKVELVFLCAIIVLSLVVGYFVLRSGSNTDTNNPPKFIQADFIDLKKIYSISKFRSGSGHDFSGGGETCRSMKHYFNTQDNQEKMSLFEQNNGIPPKPDGINDINIYSPVDGTIADVQREQMPIGEQIYISPKSNPNYTIRLFHIYLNERIKKGSKISAGQKIGIISLYQNTDIAILAGRYSRKYISYFDVMPDNIFAKYVDRGVKSRSELIISKEARDADPLQCNGEMFVQKNDNFDPKDFIFLSGYINPQPTILKIQK